MQQPLSRARAHDDAVVGGSVAAVVEDVGEESVFVVSDGSEGCDCRGGVVVGAEGAEGADVVFPHGPLNLGFLVGDVTVESEKCVSFQPFLERFAYLRTVYVMSALNSPDDLPIETFYQYKLCRLQ